MITYYDAGGPFTAEQFLAISQDAKTAPPNVLRQESIFNLHFFFQRETALKSVTNTQSVKTNKQKNSLETLH